MEAIDALSNEFSRYETQIVNRDGFQAFEIINQTWDENISVMKQDNEFVFFFAYQHAHFDDINSLIEYINEYLTENLVSIEFFIGDEDIFGGSRNLKDIDTTTGISLLKSFTGNNTALYKQIVKHLKGKKCYCKIRGWNCKHNIDFPFEIK